LTTERKQIFIQYFNDVNTTIW